MPAYSEEPRPRGFLSESDRRYLRDPEAYADEHSRQSLKERRRAIRERTRNALLDFTVLFEELDEDLRDEVLDVKAHDLYRLWYGMVGATAFFYEVHEIEAWNFAFFLEEVVDEMWENPDRKPTGKERIGEMSWKPPLADRRAEERVYVNARDKLLRGEIPTNRELGVLVKWGGLLFEENLDVIREWLGEHAREQWREEKGERIGEMTDMFGSGYSIPPAWGEDDEAGDDEADEPD